MNQLTLYYTPGACSLSPHIALREADLEFQLVRVDLRAKQLADVPERGAPAIAGGPGPERAAPANAGGPNLDWMSINPKGYVPALRLADGQILTEGAVIVQYIADQVPDAKLAAPCGTLERFRLQETLHFIATELHKGMGPLYNSLAGDDLKRQVKERVGGRFAALSHGLRDRPFLMGDRFTVADGYAFYVARAWQHSVKESLASWPELVDYYRRIAARPAVAAALEVEGITA